MADVPSVLFVCNSNRGKSQMAGALMRRLAAERGVAVDVHTAGVQVTPGNPESTTVNSESAASVAALGATFEGERPKAVDPELLRSVDRAVVVGTADLRPVESMHGALEVWDTDEPSVRGIDGAERMDLIRDDINARVATLLDELTAGR
ncbi:MAG: low molecular weight phosphatase family protein [Micrococcus sp.]|nr:low molecular weight phosphatase family protein [Micrococcus sp.]